MTSAIFLCAAQPSPGGDLRLSEPDSHRGWQGGRFCNCGQFSQHRQMGMVLKRVNRTIFMHKDNYRKHY